MVDRIAQTELNNKYPNQIDKDAETGILNVAKIFSTPGADATVDELTDELIIENFPNITGINLDGHKLTKLKIINCPELKNISASRNTQLEVLNFEKVKIDGSGNAVDADKLIEIGCDRCKIKDLSFKYCSKLRELRCQDNPNLDYFSGIESLKDLQQLVISGGTKIRLLHSDKLEYYRGTVKVIRDTLGLGPEDDLPKDSSGKLDLSNLKTEIETQAAAGSAQLKIEKKNAEKERDEAKSQLKASQAENNQMKQNVKDIAKKLGLDENSAQIVILDKIGELMKRPGPGKDDSSRISELESQLKQKNQRISELESERNSLISKQNIVESSKNSFLTISDAKQTEIAEASNSQEA